MSLHIWNTSRLAVALAERKLSSEQRFAYLVASNVIWVCAGYFGSLFVSPSSGWLFWYEGLLVVVVTVFGLIRCRAKYQGVADDRLLEAYVVLSVPLSVKVVGFTWLAHLGVGWGLQALVSNLHPTSESPLALIEFLLKAAYTFYPFLIAAFTTIFYYMRLATHLETVAAGTNGT